MTPNNPAKNLKQATIAVHGGERTDAQQLGVVVSPVFQSSTLAFQDFDEMRRYARAGIPYAYFYSCYANPTVAEAERKIAELKRAEAGVVTSSGSAATLCTIPALCAVGDEVIATDSVYGGTAGVSCKRPLTLARVRICCYSISNGN